MVGVWLTARLSGVSYWLLPGCPQRVGNQENLDPFNIRSNPPEHKVLVLNVGLQEGSWDTLIQLNVFTG